MAFLPRELAALHAPGMGFGDELALAPWGIDDATDGLYEHRARPSDHLWLVAQSLASLFWGLHDWAHFHSHGPFTQRAWTELQCDASALAWLWRNRETIGLSASRWLTLYDAAVRIGRARFAEEGMAVDAISPGAIQGWSP